MPPRVYSGLSAQTTITIPRIEQEARADGELDEPAWRQASVLTGFSLYQPVDGRPAPDSTDVLLWYSPTALYVGVRAYESHAPVHATLADRDKIAGDDNIQLFLDTFNDRRRAYVFAVNPLGVQADGMRSEGSGAGLAGGTPGQTDLSPDYTFESKGHLTPWGYQVEIRIPFTSLRFPVGQRMAWGINVQRIVQHSGYTETWTQAHRATASFLSEAGLIESLDGVHRGTVLELNPEATARATGGEVSTGTLANGDSVRWRYSPTSQLGGNLKYDLNSALTLNGTIRPDFSQVEADATQFTYDPRVKTFFTEKRPFFLESQEQFSTPNRLIYTRQITQPVAAAKLTGKVGGFDLGYLSAVDNQDASFDGKHSPVFNVLRAQRDIGSTSRIGLVYTDKIDGDNWNRVAGIDGRLVRGIVSFQAQEATSFTHTAGGTVTAPLFNFATIVNGRRWGGQYTMNGISPNFDAQSGFIARNGIANVNFTQHVTLYGKPGALIEAITPELAFLTSWRYDDFIAGRAKQDQKFHIRGNLRLRGGWGVGAQLLLEDFGYDRDLYGNYVTLRPRVGGVDTVAYSGTPHLRNADWVASIVSPEFKRFSFNTFALYGKDENFPEWSSSDIAIVNISLNVRPTDQIRLGTTWDWETYDRKTDGTRVQTRNVPRVRVEYQVTRQIFVRVIGEVAMVKQDSLRDDSRTNAPVFFRNADGSLTRAAAFDRSRGRLDFLFSYLPTPGTVFYFGYGDRSTADRPGGTNGLRPTRDVFFVKFSYLIRLQ